MNFVDAHRLAQRIALRPGRHPGLVGPLVAGVEYDGCGRRRCLGERRQRVGLAVPGPVVAADLVLVPNAGSDAGNEQLPDARAAERAHRVRPAVPVVEVPDYAHPAGARRPDGERGPLKLRPHPRAEDAPQLLMPALADQVQVHLAERGQVPVRVVDEQLGPVGAVGHREPVLADQGHGRPRPLLSSAGRPVASRRRPGRHRDREHALVHMRHRVPAAVGQDDVN